MQKILVIESESSLLLISGGRLAGNGTEAKLHILPNDSPYGLIGFTETFVTIAEDHLPGLHNTTEAVLEVYRSKGDKKDVMVSWHKLSTSNILYNLLEYARENYSIINFHTC